MPIDRTGAPLDDDDRYEGADLYADEDDDDDDGAYDPYQAQQMPGMGMPGSPQLGGRPASGPQAGSPYAPLGATVPPIPAIPIPPAGPPTQPRAQTGGASQSPAEPVTVVAQGLRKDFVAGGEMVRAVDNVSFTLTNRQFVAITGPSGCGKTTLLYMLGSLEQPTAGSAMIDGVDVATLTPQAADQFRRKSIGFVFQSFYLIPNLSALENVMLPMEIAKVPRKFRRERAEYLLQQVGLDKNRHHHLPSKLSGGQQQRVAIARALANDPTVVLADEPTGNLDSNNSKRLVSLLRTLARQGRTIVMVTHDRGIARLADLRVDLVDGRIVRMTTPGQGGGQAAADQGARRGPNTRGGSRGAGQRW
jgi:ABC-type lipoprotein export system ATPase subunit